MNVRLSDDLCCRFSVSEWYNEEILKIISKVFQTVKQVELVEGDKVLASVPTTYNAMGEYAFMGWSLPFARWEWFCDDIENLILLEKIGREQGVQIDIVNLLMPDGEYGLKKDSGISLIEVKDFDEYVQSYKSKSHRNSIRRAMRIAEAENMEYRLVRVTDTFALLEYWFDLYENDSLEAVKGLYQYWEEHGYMKAYGIFHEGEMVAADFLLYGRDWVNGMLTPWYKDREEVVKLQVGYFAIVKAVEKLYEEGISYFSIGEASFAYKAKWTNIALPAYCLGLGRWEDR